MACVAVPMGPDGLTWRSCKADREPWLLGCLLVQGEEGKGGKEYAPVEGLRKGEKTNVQMCRGEVNEQENRLLGE